MDEVISIRRAASVHRLSGLPASPAPRLGRLADDSYVIPIATMVGAQLHGGVVLGLFCPTAKQSASRSRSSVARGPTLPLLAAYRGSFPAISRPGSDIVSRWSNAT